MKDTDKVTLTLGQIKRLVVESKKQKLDESIKEFNGITISDLRKLVKYLTSLKDEAEWAVEDANDFLDAMETVTPETFENDKSWQKTLMFCKKDFNKSLKRLKNRLNSFPSFD